MSSENVIVRCHACGAQNRIPAARSMENPRCGKCHAALSMQRPPDHPVVVSDATFDAEVLRQPGAVLVDFWAPWCGPCRMVAPVLDDLARKYSGKCKIAKVNVDENRVSATRYGIQSIPALLLFKDGKLVDTVVGALGKQELERRLAGVIRG